MDGVPGVGPSYWLAAVLLVRTASHANSPHRSPAASSTLRILIGVLAAILAAPTAANNGLNLIGFGGESALMAGADTAVTHDTTSLNTNPAGLARIESSRFDVYAATAFALDVAHADQFGNNVQVSNSVIPIGGGGFARRLAGTNVVAGIGFFVQGGAGAVFQDLATPFGTRDELSALTGIVKLTPGLAWQVSDALVVGASLAVTYAQAKQRIFPNTSVFNPADPGQSFFGSSLDDVHSVAAGFRVGAQFRPTPTLTLGAVYANRVALPLDGGTLVANMSAIGLGNVVYSEVRLEGIALPSELSLGAAWQPAEDMLVSLKVSRLAWSKAISTLVLDAGHPSTPSAPAEIHTIQNVGWHDRNVVALGLRKDAGARIALLAGINYGRRPMDDETLSPIFAPTGQTHVTGGLAYRLGHEYELFAGLEYQFPERIRYTNPQLPFGLNTETRNEYVAMHLMLSRRW